VKVAAALLVKIASVPKLNPPAVHVAVLGETPSPWLSVRVLSVLAEVPLSVMPPVALTMSVAAVVPLMVLPVVLFLKPLPFLRQLALFLVACLAALVLVSPWLIANLTRFDDPVLFSTNDGLTICGANLERTWYGDGTGLWALDCAGFPVPKGDRSVVSNQLRSDGLHFIKDHLGRLPTVVAVRIARVWSLYAPGQMASYNVNEGRDEAVSWAGFVTFWLLVPCAVVGGVLLRRRRVPITPLVAQFVVVTITAAAIYGLARFRTPAEVSLVVLAAVALDHWLGGRAETAEDAASRPMAVEASA